MATHPRRRLDELDREWDTERTLEANAAVISLIALRFKSARVVAPDRARIVVICAWRPRLYRFFFQFLPSSGGAGGDLGLHCR